MASAEEMPLNEWLRPIDFVPPKPLSTREILKLGAALDLADRSCAAAWDGDTGRYWLTPDTMPVDEFYALCDRLSDATVEYVRAINTRDLSVRIKWENAKRPPKSADAFALRAAMHEAQALVDEIECIGRDFFTDREVIDRNAAADLAERRYEIAQTKYQAADKKRRQQNKADADANIVRVTHRRKSNEVHL